MPRRKKRSQPGEIEKISSEDTQEMWVVAGARSRDEAELPGEYQEYEEPEALEDYEEFEEPDELHETEVLDESEESDESGQFDDFDDDPGTEEYEEPDDPEEDWYEEETGEEPFSRVPVFGLPGEDPEPEPERDPDPEPERNPEPSPEVKTAPGRSLASRLPKITVPDIPDPNPRHLMATVGVIAVALLAGFGTYQLGKGSGDSLDSARLEGEAAGRQAGAVEGASAGFAEGYRRGREKGFARAYSNAYRIHYKRAFEQAGLDVPKNSDIDVPAP